jgi:hypothetical protein
VLTGLTADAMRADDETRETYEADLQKLAATIAEGMKGEAAAERAWTLLSLFAGGSALARAVKDPKTRAAILDSVRASAHRVCEGR